uniref:Uncharacterized protein n=1 Tax=Marseillevirus LCMAC101 TaxID=2506602 RepID=A0A481YQM2_9VIRU|nr:MAG: hypothetical protein LCMAC101_00650 [Marseillevirus LCMAC101]
MEIIKIVIGIIVLLIVALLTIIYIAPYKKENLNGESGSINLPKPTKKKDKEKRAEHHFDENDKLIRICFVEPGDGKGNYSYSSDLLREVQKYYPLAEYPTYDDGMAHMIKLHNEKDESTGYSINLKKGAWRYCASFIS